ncbi:MAG: secondary thiamine-phosphate synthase enzyme YjbQ [Bacteroidia bacterium]|nr:secondary thiamine-phosphate synthase enzyme YjbQ [Bacteroidia bacterium]
MDQYIITLAARNRGFHLVTEELLSQLPVLSEYTVGLAHFHILHTSASLSVNENADPTVRSDMERWYSTAVPDGATDFRHRLEGDDDMPAHIKASLIGSSLLLPVRAGRLLLGTWQGIYLGEHRNAGGPRRVAVTLTGDKR